VLAVLGVLVLGVVVGAVAGFYGRFVDGFLSRVTDIFYALPAVLGALVLLRTGVLGPLGPRTVAIALALFSWMTAMRLVRSQVIAVKSSDYVAAARAMGASDYRILVRHILPNAVAPVLVFATITIGVLIAAEATLTYLGVGLQAPAISWGLQIAQGQALLRTAPHLVLFPSIALTLTVMAFILMGDALRDALDPRQR
jgi:oligopeptide transport system permease protein